MWDGPDYDASEFGDMQVLLNIESNSMADAIASDLLMTGWFDPEATPDERMQAREDLYEFLDDFYDWDEFWDEWREWYSEQ